jgi:hypothetical protein
MVRASLIVDGVGGTTNGFPSHGILIVDAYPAHPPWVLQFFFHGPSMCRARPLVALLGPS